ncbi:MAG: lipoyl synthase [candidate division WOR-3 bacterium]
MKKPAWLKFRLPSGAEFERVNSSLSRFGLNTVCSSARCPNLADCWNRGTATVMILGDTCTRHCRFCAVSTGNPRGAVDPEEPERVARAVAELGLKYVVLTSVDRDDLADSGADIFCRTVRAIKAHTTAGRRLATDDSRLAVPVVEVLTPDFAARRDLLQLVVAAGPDVFGHNLETVERLTPQVRDPRASYRKSLQVLETVKELAPNMLTKSSLMVGLGETDAEVSQALRDLRSSGCDIVTVGQYLQPNRRCLPVSRYVTPERFADFAAKAKNLGFRSAFCGPLVRSSYRAEEALG